MLNDGILNLNSEDFDQNPQRVLNRPSSMSRASPSNRFVLNQTQPVRQSAEQVGQSPVGSATMQQLNNINIESNEILAKQGSEANSTTINTNKMLLPNS